MKKRIALITFCLMLIFAQGQEHSQIERDYFYSDSLAEAGDFAEAVDPAQRALKGAIKLYGEKDEFTMLLKQNLARILFYAEDYESAEPLLEENVLYAKKTDGLESEMYASNLREWAICLDSLQRDDELEILCETRLAFLREKKRAVSVEYLLYSLDLSDLLIRAERYDEAIQCNLEAYEYEKALSESNPWVGDKAAGNLVWLYFNNDEVEAGIPWLKIQNNYQYGILAEALRADEETRTLAIEALKSNEEWMQGYNHSLHYEYDALNEIVLNNQLVLKGLILSNAKSKISYLRDLQVAEIDRLITELFQCEHVFWEGISNEAEVSHAYLDSLNLEIQEKYSQINNLYSEHFGTGVTFDRTWREIQTHLKPDEVAIDFSSFSRGDLEVDTGAVFYVASIISPTFSSPKTIFLFEQAELELLLASGGPNQLYASRGAYDAHQSFDEQLSTLLFNLIWKPILNETEALNRIYFSPSGLLNQVSMAALEDANGISMVNKFDLVQLLNLYSITEKKREPKRSPAILVGGINYDFVPDQDLTSTVDSIFIDNTWKFLPGTLAEIEQISALYQSKKLEVIKVTGDTASEDWFKSIAFGGPSVLHLATHGFSLPEEQVLDWMLESMDDGFYMPPFGLEAMERSGLLLAHANFAWANWNNAFEVEDGVLMADEVKGLNLQNTDLVVLSACESGLGDISGSEGVFGLQRAFRLAGVKYMMLSLWQVPDKETSEFMELFYTNWLGGKSIREAFNHTQRIMSLTYKNEPEKWAAFVLVE